MARVDDIKALLKRYGTVTARTLEQQGINRRILSRLQASGELVRVARGIYASREAEGITAHHSLAVAARRVPRGVICLLSALRFHEIGTQIPSQVWIGLPRGARIPAEAMIHAVHYNLPSFQVGVEQHRIEGTTVSIFSPAKTVADCFKFRNQIGLDVAIEALRESLAGKKATIDDIWTAAGHCRVPRVIRPYLEALA